MAPAGPLPEEELEEAVAHLRAWGLEVELGKYVTERHPELGYLAGTDEQRAEDFTRMWHSGVRAVWCARGGYGCQRMAALLDPAELRGADAPLLLGSSDVTLLHQHLGTRFGHATLFSPMPVTDAFRTRPGLREHVRRALFEPDEVVLRGEPIGPKQHVTGTTVGGTASLLSSTLGTALHVPPPDGAIALLEDVTEAPYRLDRILTQLVQSGWFDRVRGIGIGSLHNCGDPDAARRAVCSALEPLGLPMLWGLGFGHGPRLCAVPLGSRAELDPEEGTLRIEPVLE